MSRNSYGGKSRGLLEELGKRRNVVVTDGGYDFRKVRGVLSGVYKCDTRGCKGRDIKDIPIAKGTSGEKSRADADASRRRLH